MSTTLLYKYRKVDENTLSIFINDEVHFSSVESFNDPFDGQLNLFDGLRAFLENSEELELPDDYSKTKKICDDANKELANTGMFSLSTINNQIIMWSHYSDHHKGICIGFSREGLIEEFGSASSISTSRTATTSGFGSMPSPSPALRCSSLSTP